MHRKFGQNFLCKIKNYIREHKSSREGGWEACCTLCVSILESGGTPRFLCDEDIFITFLRYWRYLEKVVNISSSCLCKEVGARPALPQVRQCTLVSFYKAWSTLKWEVNVFISNRGLGGIWPIHPFCSWRHWSRLMWEHKFGKRGAKCPLFL